MQIARWFTSSTDSQDEPMDLSSWSVEAADLFEAEAFCKNLPNELRVVEENTVPSWLWRHSGAGSNNGTEYSLAQVFDRVAGSAAYLGWKKGLFSNEVAARSFFDETRWLLAHGVVVVEPAVMAGLGADWAYGLASAAFTPVYEEAAHNLNLPNAAIDTILAGVDNGTQNRWHRFLDVKAGQKLTLRFTDTTNEWGMDGAAPVPTVAIDLAKLMREEGVVNTGALQHATQISVILLELHYENLVASSHAPRALALAPINVARVLMQQGIAYDSAEGRSMAAGLAALMTASAVTASARLARHFGPCADFIRDRVSTLRHVANRRRAVYGDRNDYEHVSVLPVSLSLEACPDLALVAEARHAWDESYVESQRYGLRHAGLTHFVLPPVFGVLCGSSIPGMAPSPSLVVAERIEEDRYVSSVHPAVPMALARLGYAQDEMKSIIAHIIGHHTLKGSPVLNHEVLMARGFTNVEIEKIESKISEVNDVRLAVTPWVVGERFCSEVLKVPAKDLEGFDFDLMSFVGFSTAEIVGANHYCYGHGNVETASEMRHEHRALFLCGDDVSIEARLAMAASVQTFVTGDVDLGLTLPASAKTEERSRLLMEAWQAGLKKVSLYFDYSGAAAPVVKEVQQPVEQTQQVKQTTKPRSRTAMGKPAPQSAIPKAQPALSPTRRSRSVTSSVALRKENATRGRKART